MNGIYFVAFKEMSFPTFFFFYTQNKWIANCRREQEKSNSKSKYVYIYLFRYEHWFHRLQIVQVPGNLYAKCILKSIRQITISINIQQRKNKIQFEMERKFFKHKQF